MDDGQTAQVVEITALGTAGRFVRRPGLLQAALLSASDVPPGYVVDPGATSMIALLAGDRPTGRPERGVEAHFVLPGADQILEENIRSYETLGEAQASFAEADRAARAFVAFTNGDNQAIRVTAMPVPRYGDATFALRLSTAESLTAVASHVRIGRLQVTVLMAGGVVDPRRLVTLTHRAVEKMQSIRQ